MADGMNDTRQMQYELVEAIMTEIALRQATPIDAVISLLAVVETCIETACAHYENRDEAISPFLLGINLLVERLRAPRNRH
jgi:hypothetical protein